MIVKRTNGTGGWAVGSNSMDTWAKVLYLNEDAKAYDQVEPFNDTKPTQHVFELFDSGSTNATGGNYIAYCWHNVPGLQKFGKYTGNGSANGPFVELGFRPAILMVKEVNNNSTRWCVWDDAWDNKNPMGENLFWNSNAAKSDSANHNFDLLSNGFKARTTSDNRNRSNATYVYAAWAEAPSFNLYGGESNAR